MDDTDFAMMLDGQIAGIEDEMRRDSRWAKLERLRALRALYPPTATGTIKPPKAPGLALMHVKRRGKAMNPERANALAHAKMNLMGAVEPIKTAVLYKMGAADGIRLPGSSPENALAQLLIRDPEILSHGRAGWSLITETPEAPDDLLTRTASEASNSSLPDQRDNPDVRPVDPVPGGGT